MTGHDARPNLLRRTLDRVGLASRSVAESAVATWRSLTSGHRWSSAVLLTVAVLVVAFGLPTRNEVTQGPGSPASAGFPGEATSSSPDPEERAAVPLAADERFQPGRTPAEPPTTGAQVPSPPALPGGAGAADGQGPPPTFVALVRTGDGNLPGQDDADIARIFLDEASFDAEVVELAHDEERGDEADEELCLELRAAGSVVLASTDLPEMLRSCLMAAGMMVVAHDGVGTTPRAHDRGGIVSTRRSHRDSLTDLARWGIEEGVLDGRVGIVVSEELEGVVRGTIPALRRMGVGIRAVTVLPNAADASLAVAAGVSDHADKSIDVVVFAAAMHHQRDWVVQEAVVRPGVEYVVSDLGEGILEEGYLPTFEGFAHTSLRTPWFERDEGETPAQKSCRERWEEASDPSGENLAAPRLARVFMWCQTVSMMVERALASFSRGTSSFDEALRERSVASPLTSTLGPLPDDGFGPTEDAVLAWDRACRCWMAERGFNGSARPESSGAG